MLADFRRLGCQLRPLVLIKLSDLLNYDFSPLKVCVLGTGDESDSVSRHVRVRLLCQCRITVHQLVLVSAGRQPFLSLMPKACQPCFNCD